MRYHMVKHFVDMYDTMKQWDTIGSGANKQCAAQGKRGLLLCGELFLEQLEGRFWQNEGWMLWKLHQKHHLMQHILEDQVAVAGNPRDCLCYLDESEIGAAKNVAKSVHPSTWHRTVIEKSRLGL